MHDIHHMCCCEYSSSSSGANCVLNVSITSANPFSISFVAAHCGGVPTKNDNNNNDDDDDGHKNHNNDNDKNNTKPKVRMPFRTTRDGSTRSALRIATPQNHQRQGVHRGRGALVGFEYCRYSDSFRPSRQPRTVRTQAERTEATQTVRRTSLHSCSSAPALVTASSSLSVVSRFRTWMGLYSSAFRRSRSAFIGSEGNRAGV